MKLKNPNLIFVRTDRQDQSSMPIQLFKSWGHKKFRDNGCRMDEDGS